MDKEQQEFKVEVGKVYRTPWEPSGLVRVLEIEPGFYFGQTSVFVEYVTDHPSGYKKGDIGRYLLKEMRPAYTHDEQGCREKFDNLEEMRFGYPASYDDNGESIIPHTEAFRLNDK